MSAPRTDGVIGLGSNLGDRRAALCRAARACARLGRLVAVSALYETRPVGGPEQPDYLNAALRLHTDLEPEALWGALADIERGAGRARAERWGPRTLDLDILWIFGTSHRSSTLVIPHPRLAERAFALLPLLDVAPDAIDPDTGLPFVLSAQQVSRNGVRTLDETPRWAGLTHSVTLVGQRPPRY
jgi:2-amino-4-hydroxy-6-hydroxymethyldihydropteridine diphosphokinase